MKNMRIIVAALALVLVLCGCGVGTDAAVQRPYEVAATATRTTVPTTTPTSTVTPTAVPSSTPVATATPHVVALPKDRLFLGVYDRWQHRFDGVPMDVEHDFISWEKSGEIAAFIANTRSVSRVPMITLESWVSASGVITDVIQDTIAGRNDNIIRADARSMKAAAPQVVLVRFAHEMELVGNYPWSTPDAKLHIAMYRHFVNIFRDEGVDNVLWIWAPAGNDQAQKYYPGDDVVDMISVTVLGYEAWDLRFGAKQAHSFDELIGGKYALLNQFGKPIIVGELGVCASAQGRTEAEQEQYKADWLRDAKGVFSNYPLLRGIVYFDSFNAPNAWTGDTPDWRIQPSSLWKREEMPGWR